MRQPASTVSRRTLAIVGWSVGLTLTAASAVFAGPREDAEAAMARCRSIPDDRAWVACYDAALSPMRGRLGAPPPPPAAPPPMAAGPRAPYAPPPPARAEAVAAGPLRMTAYSFNPFGIFTVTLSDGEVWKQVEGDTTKARWNGPASKYEVRISAGVLGSTNLRVQGDPRIYKVHRLK